MSAAYSSFLSSSFPLFFKKTDADLIDIENMIIYFNKAAKQADREGLKNENREFFKLEPMSQCKMSISWFILPILLIVVNFAIIGLYISHGAFSLVEQIEIAVLVLVVAWSSYLSAQPSKNSRKIDFLIMLMVGIISISVAIHSLISGNLILLISSSIIAFNMIVFMETIKPVLLLFARDEKHCFLFGDDKKFILIMEKKNVKK